MGCDKCDAVAETGSIYWFRWGAANVGIVACQHHFMEIREALMAAQVHTNEAATQEMVDGGKTR